MKIERNYFYDTCVCKTKTYRKIYEELDKKFVSQVIENIYKYCEFDFNTYVNSKEVHDRPKNIEEFEELFERFLEHSNNFINVSNLRYDSPGTTVKSSYFYCPKCHTWHRDYKFLTPIMGWEYILDKYGEIITLDILYRIFIDGYYRSVCNVDMYGEVFFLLYDEKLAMQMYEEAKEKGDNPYLLKPQPPLLNSKLKYYTNKYIPYDEFVRGNNGMPILKCPSCGCEIYLERSYNFDSVKSQNYNFKYLTRCGTWFSENAYPINYEVFSNEGDPKIVLSIIYYHYFPNVYGKMRIKKTNDRIVFNTETGLSYELRSIDLDTKQPIFEETRIKNVTYSSYLRRPLPDEVVQDTIDAICKKKKVKTISTKLLQTTKSNNLSILTAVNRYAKLGEEFLYNYLDTNACGNLNKREKRELFEMQTEPDIFLKILKKKKISSKCLRKTFIKNPMLIQFYETLLKIGFKNIDVIMSLVKSEKMVPIFKNLNNYGRSFSSYNLKKFVEDYTSFKTEAELAKKIMVTKDLRNFTDIGNIYSDCTPLWRVLNENQKKKIFKGSIEDIHNCLVQLSNSISKKEFYIPYTMNELSYNCECGDYVFTLAKTSSELTAVGKTMHICVGSYSNRALYKECVIVLMRDKRTKELAVCIELSPDYKKMKQAKDFCNREVSPEKLSALVSYFEKYHIEYASAYDGERNNLDKVEKRENAIQLNDTDGYMIFDSKEQFKKVLIDKIITVDNEVIQLPEDFFEDDEIQENLFMDMPFI